MAGGAMFSKKLGGVRIVGRERCDRNDYEDQAEFHQCPHFPTICFASFSFSLQTYSPMSSPASSSDALVIFHGFAYVPGSSIVNSISRCPRSGRRKRSITCIISVCG